MPTAVCLGMPAPRADRREMATWPTTARATSMRSIACSGSSGVRPVAVDCSGGCYPASGRRGEYGELIGYVSLGDIVLTLVEPGLYWRA